MARHVIGMGLGLGLSEGWSDVEVKLAKHVFESSVLVDQMGSER